VGLNGEELAPGRSGPVRGRIDARSLQDRPDGGGGDGVAESGEFALNASVFPGWVLSAIRTASVRSGAGVGPAAGDQLGVPAQRGSR
jgi:hypothetical protein